MIFTAFWAINGNLNIAKLKQQLNHMKEFGLDGVIFHPRNYPNQPAYMGKEYLSILSEVILYAKALSMEFWIYDENGWPSGSGNGQVLAKFPNSKCQWLVYEDNAVVIKEKNNFNTLNREQMDYFIELIYEGYRCGLEFEKCQFSGH